ncbi:hypothetical protein CONPUDRAFT_53237 [Coniophora puteana RWD-64-598 SS2]|uniref:Uncharacterized protein n=1 Tax=Coniophora puteana (strain RWD-64-598) TaxID=741705 RepID=A0A5M3MWL1_CONPW|nr:uncharacterized protein CONPUDRAFT_53237 [Coniophora puteana RWD-64-598 SS2]EIW83532.1 hypothetical protein CONPUDRAFT_53237 [Coniophora puteana RWD-64-598 SS2]
MSISSSPEDYSNFISDRSTWDIISSCLLTLLACVYTAVHPNIPSPDDEQLCVFVRQAGIMTLAMIAPELIVVWAIRQWVSAYWLTEQIRIMQAMDESWTLTHSFFAFMGGFMVYHDGKPYATITPYILLREIANGTIKLPNLTEDEVKDCSKGDWISKGLVLIQVGWFITQLISRTVYHLESSQLEIATFAYSILCLFTYAFWWRKPLNVQCPRRIDWTHPSEPPDDLCEQYVFIRTFAFSRAVGN